MAKVFTAQNNFTSGKLSALVQARTNLKAYSNGLKTCENFIVLPHGGITRRGGFTYVSSAKNATESSGATILVPFIFSSTPTQSYILEFDATDLVIRFYYGYNKTLVTSGGSAYTVDFSDYWAATDIPNLRWVQSADVLYFVDGSHAPVKLIRNGHADWELQEMVIAGEPFAPGNVVTYKLNTFTNAFFTSHGIGGYGGDDFWIFDSAKFQKLFEIGVTELSTGNYEIDDDYGVSFIKGDLYYPEEPALIGDQRTNNKLVDDNWALQLEGDIYLPCNGLWSFAMNTCMFGELAFDDNHEIIIKVLHYQRYCMHSDSRLQYANYSDAIGTDIITHADVDNIVAGEHYFRARAATLGDSLNTFGMDIGYRYDGNLKGPFASDGSTGTSGSDIAFVKDRDTYAESDAATYEWFGDSCFEIKVAIDGVGTFAWYVREITGWNSDGDIKGAWNEIATGIGISGDVIDSDTGYGLSNEDYAGGNSLATIYFTSGGDYDLGDYWTFKVGYLVIPGSAFTSTRLAQDTTYPKCVTIHQNRLWFGNLSGRPTTLLASKVGEFENFVIDQTYVDDDDPIDVTISSNKIDPIQWIAPGRTLLVGTTSTEYSITGENGYLSPSNITITPHTFNGSRFVDPVQVDNSILFIEKSGLRIREIYYRYDIDGYYTEDQSILSYEELSNKIKQLVFQQAGKAGYLSDYSITIPPCNIIWLIDDSYELKAITFEKQHEVIAWHTHDLGGSTVEVQSIAVIPGSDGSDELWALVKRDDARYIEYLSSSAAYDNDGGADQITFTATAETLPIQYDEEGNVTRMFKKRWAEIRAYLYGARNVSVAEGSDTWASWKQTFGTVAVGPEDERLGGTGWDEESTLVLKSEPDSSPSLTSTSVTGLDDLSFGASNSYTGSDEPTIVVTIDGEGATDTFKWSLNGTEQDTTVAITGSEQQLGTTGIYIEFAAITGHTEDDYWTIEWAAYPATILQLHGKVIINEP